MSKVSNPACAYSAMASAAAPRSRSLPSRSMSATCQRPVTTRLISRPGASTMRSGSFAILNLLHARDMAPHLARSPPGYREESAGGNLGLHGVHLVGAHFADCGDLAVLDPPQTERARDVAIFVETHPADNALV